MNITKKNGKDARKGGKAGRRVEDSKRIKKGYHEE